MDDRSSTTSAGRSDLNKTFDNTSVQTDASFSIDVDTDFEQDTALDNAGYTNGVNGTPAGTKPGLDSSNIYTPTQNGNGHAGPVSDANANVEETEKKEEEVDPWALPELKETETPWSELDTNGKCKRVLLNGIVRPVLLLGLLYLFICSLDFLSSAFRLLGGKTAGEVIGSSIVATNPVCGVMVGILATVLVQSSSTTTSIVVSMVASEILEVGPAIPMIMGANIGTSVTNTIVAVFHMRDRGEFRRAFAGATVHDMFNWLAVLVLLPLELVSGCLYRLTDAIIKSMHLETNEEADVELLKVITKPFTELVIQIDKGVIKDIAQGDEGAERQSLVKKWCDGKEIDVLRNVTDVVNVTRIVDGESVIDQEEVTNLVMEKGYEDVRCNFLFSNTGLSDAALGAIVLILALVILCVCLVLIVKILHSLLKGQIAVLTKKVINSDFPGRLSWLTGYFAILVGAGLTMLVQSSSIFTSALTPLVGIGVIKIERMYPFTLGANVGTTFTAILAALASSGGKLASALQIALCHFFFNIFGIAVWYPVPVMRRVPVKLAKINGNTTAKYRWFAFFYLFVMFFIFPASMFGLSLAGWVWLGIFGLLFLLVFAFIVVVNILQSKRPQWLPKILRTWDFLPLWMHSLEPMDRLITKILGLCKFCKCLAPCRTHDPKKQGTRELASTINVVFQPDETAF